MRGQRRYGSTCCESVRADSEYELPRSPGAVITECNGPQIGRPCTSRKDCDVACFCDPHADRVLLRPGDAPSGPPDGTRGVTGSCGGRIQVGVSICEIDEFGKVVHKIID